MKQLLTLFIFATLLSACSQTPKSAIPDLIFVNGNFFTADSLHPQATAVAILNDRILAVGTDADLKKLADKNTQIIDLQGNFAMPGFIEGHGHFNSLGSSLQNLNLMNIKSWAEITGLVAEKTKSAKPGDWIEGRGWHQEKWSESPGATVNGYPYNTALSAVSPNNPVVLFHVSGHGLIANAKAIELAGISSESSDPIGGRIVRDAGGKLTGVFEENAMDLILKPFSAWNNLRPEAERTATWEKAAQLAAAECLAKGITSFQDAGSNFWELTQYRRLAETNQLPVRIWAMAFQPTAHDIPKLKNYPQIGLGNQHFTCRAVKCYFDGALGSYGAWLLAPYDDKPGFVGQNTTPIDTIARLAKACHENGLQLCVHAIGDRANREILNVVEKEFAEGNKSPDANSKSSVKRDKSVDKRWRMEHAQHIDIQDIPRFGQLGVIASMQAIHCTSDAPFVVKRLGVERARTGAYAWRSLLDSGAHLANGTDTPVEDVNPLPCLYASITRKPTNPTPEGVQEEAFFPEQKMKREEALLSYTIWNAWAAFEENEKGSLAPGKLADIVVLSKDLLRCAPEEILQAKVLKTVVGGKVMYDAEKK